MINNKLNYFKEPFNLINLSVSVLLFINCFDEEIDQPAFWTVQTWAALLLWYRFILYLRTFPRFSWLVRMIQACVYDMKVFFVVLIIGIFAFADAFLSIDQIINILNRPADEVEVFDPSRGAEITEEMGSFEAHYQTYWRPYVIAWQNSFLTALGEFNGDLEFYREGDWLVFFLCVIFNIVLLFNLLISIISETFAVFAANAVQASYKEKAI